MIVMVVLMHLVMDALDEAFLHRQQGGLSLAVPLVQRVYEARREEDRSISWIRPNHSGVYATEIAAQALLSVHLACGRN